MTLPRSPRQHIQKKLLQLQRIAPTVVVVDPKTVKLIAVNGPGGRDH